jgi:hypothetical protein
MEEWRNGMEVCIHHSWPRHWVKIGGQFTPRPICTRGNCPQYLSKRRLGGPHSRSECCGGERRLTTAENRVPGVQPIAPRYRLNDSDYYTLFGTFSKWRIMRNFQHFEFIYICIYEYHFICLIGRYVVRISAGYLISWLECIINISLSPHSYGTIVLPSSELLPLPPSTKFALNFVDKWRSLSLCSSLAE